MNKEFFKSLLLMALIGLTVIMTKNLLDSKTPDITKTTTPIMVEEVVQNIDQIIYPQDFVLSFGGGSYTGVYSEQTREGIWHVTTELLYDYLTSLHLEIVTEEEFQTVEKTRSVKMTLPFAISINDLAAIYGAQKEFNDFSDRPIETIIISSSQKDRVYLANVSEQLYFYLRSDTEDDRISDWINRVSQEEFTEYRRVDGLINFKALKEDESKVFYNNQIIPITTMQNIPFIKVTKEIDATEDRQNSEIKTFLMKAFGSSTDFVKRLEEVDGSQTYIYGYGDKALRLGIDGKITYQEKVQSTVKTETVDFKEGLTQALRTVKNYGSSPKSLYLADYKTYEEDGHEIKVYAFNYRVKDLNVYTKSMRDGYGIEVVLKDDVVTKFTKNIRRYVKSIDASEIWTDGPVYIENLINDNFGVISKNFNQDMKVDFRDTEANWQMTTYVLSIMQNLKSAELYYYLDSSLDDERLIPAWKVVIANTRYYFHLYTGDVLLVEKLETDKLIEISRR